MEEEDDQRRSSPLPEKTEEATRNAGSSSGWGDGWGFSSFSVLSSIQKAAEEISRSAVAVARDAAKGISDVQAEEASHPDSGGGGSGEMDLAERTEAPAPAEMSSGSNDVMLRKSALDRLEEASQDSIFGQGLKAIDSSVESITSGAWNALGFAWKEGSNLVQRLELSSLAETIQHNTLPSNTLAPSSIIETGKSLTTKGIQVLERVGKETMEMLIAETGLVVEKNAEEVYRDSEEQLEEVTFDRCFYIYGGPDQLEELEALSNHYALLYNRRKAKLLSQQKSLFDEMLRQIQQTLTLVVDSSKDLVDLDKGKDIESPSDSISREMKILLSSSVKKAADMAAGYTTTLGGLAADEIVQRTSDRLESVHSEGVHRLAELCCFAVSQLLVLGKSIISTVTQSSNEDAGNVDDPKIDWPDDSISKATSIRTRACSMSVDVESISNSFLTGISDITEAYLAAMQKASSSGGDGVTSPLDKSIPAKATEVSDHLRADRAAALSKIGEAMQYLAYVIVSTSMSST